MIRNHRSSSTPRRFASTASLERSARRRSRSAAALGLALGLALPPLLSTAGDHLPRADRANPGIERSGSSSEALRWSPARLSVADMVRENPGDQRRLDLDGMTRR